MPGTTLREKQVRFLRYLARLILWAESQGYELTMSEGYVGDTDAADGDYDGPHMRGGAHYNRVGIDLNLFIGGVWQKASTPEWQALGQYWKSLDPLCRWGGDFASVDLNHFSLYHEGRA